MGTKKNRCVFVILPTWEGEGGCYYLVLAKKKLTDHSSILSASSSFSCSLTNSMILATSSSL
jgi:hypothetical protein